MVYFILSTFPCLITCAINYKVSEIMFINNLTSYHVELGSTPDSRRNTRSQTRGRLRRQERRGEKAGFHGSVPVLRHSANPELSPTKTFETDA